MLEQDAQVVAVNTSTATVEVQTQSSCSSCEVKTGCGTGALSKVLGRKTIRLDVNNHLQLQVGDRVVIGLNEHVLVSGAMLIYLLPLITLFLASLLGRYMTSVWGLEGEWMTIISALAGFIGGLLVVRNYSAQMDNNAINKPVVLRKQQNWIDI